MRFTVKKLTLLAWLTTAALVVFIIEAQIPLPIPVPGAKLGLANTVTLFALFYGYDKDSGKIGLTAADALMILVCRIILGAVFTGRIVALIYSAAGGTLSFAVQAALRRFVTRKQIWAVGAVGAVFHNIGQIAAAVFVTGSLAIAAYLPVLIVVGITTGVITGSVAQFTLARISPLTPAQRK